MPSGIHHVTSIASSARRNLDFYERTLGLRRVKKTVNFDDPGSYHLYYGDAAGHPGTILTFFAWEGAAPGRLGIGETQETVFSIPEGSISYWTQRLVEKGVAHDPPMKRFGATTIAFKDQDGTRLALSGVKGVEAKPGWSGGGVPAEHSIRGFHSVSLLLADAGPTAAVLTDVFGFVGGGSEETQRFQAPGVEIGGIIDLRTAGEFLSAPGGEARSSHRLSGERRCGAGRDGSQAGRQSSPANHRAEGPQSLSLGLFPRARPGAVRNRHRSALASPSTNRLVRLGSAQTAAIPGRPARGDRSRAAKARLAHETNVASSDALGSQ
jgi:glyoxalase family protein